MFSLYEIIKRLLLLCPFLFCLEICIGKRTIDAQFLTEILLYPLEQLLARKFNKDERERVQLIVARSAVSDSGWRSSRGTLS